ncbi:hypothetical protein O181_111858 [Austropuccinia psidii MF-1]|uniref:Reverse transcriptase domain-containing protein n=1 Tax=Austropuccinia psidii MF-1 TaxID=1389203 RepID=A0A9Q3K0A3_9BASI|nr:hypothetical protein [Austropuccinia psidii MF-1]
MNQLLRVFNGSSIFSNIDLSGAYKLLRIKEGDEQLPAFRTKHGSYEYLIMPFGLINAPASFEDLVNDIYQDLLDVYVVTYLDNIMVFSKSEEEHVTHVSTVLSTLRANNLFAKASKCLFHVSSVEYLGYIFSSEGLKIDQEKVQQILNCPPPRNLKALQSFLGFANFYCHFIKNFSKKISSLTSFLKKYSFPPSMRKLSVSDSGEHPIAFNSRKRISEELSYEIHDKERLGIVWALQHWRAFLPSLSLPVEVLPNHASLQYFMSSKVPTRHQACWTEFLSEFHFSINYHPGRLATPLDALSRRDDIHPLGGRKPLLQDSEYRSILQELGKGESVQYCSLDSSSQLLLFKHQGESCVNRRQLTSRQANVKHDKSQAHVEHTSYSCLTPNPVTSTNIGSPVPSTQIPHHVIIPQPSDGW